ncbi:MAG: hypothetical protein ACE5H4_10590 [Candidatus Thorarchaeota archaeon]
MQCMYAAADLAGTMKLQYDGTMNTLKSSPSVSCATTEIILPSLQEAST